MSDPKPITVYNHAAGPNPKKVFMVLEELGLPFKKIDIEDPKVESYTAINPNGRLPAIDDPSTGLVLWETGAILEYLVETYDKEGKLNVQNIKDKWHLKQYLSFQISGQGPYFGQMFWYSAFETDNPAAKKRYEQQAERVIMVLNNILQGRTYLVGDKITYADIAFIPYNVSAQYGFPEAWAKWEVEKNYPNFVAWHARLLERPAVQKIMFPGK